MKTAAITIISDIVPDLLPLWVRYYKKHFNKLILIQWEKAKLEEYEDCDIYNLKSNDADKHLLELPTFFEKFLLEYDVLCYAGIDEFVMVDPEHGTLKEYMENMGDQATATGWSPRHIDEPDIDLTKPILRQRNKWSFDPTYSKTPLMRKPLNYMAGMHYTKEIFEKARGGKKVAPQTLINKMADPKLLLLHLQRVDKKMYEKHTLYRRGWDEWKKDLDNAVLIPERFKGLL